jgi:hypothetical protein
MSDDRDRILWLAIRRALKAIILAIEKRWGVTDGDDVRR